MAVTSKFLVPGGIGWLVFGDQVDRENFRTRPEAARGLSGGYVSNEPTAAVGLMALLFRQSAKSRHLRFFSIAVIGFVRNSKASIDLNGEHLFWLGIPMSALGHGNQ